MSHEPGQARERSVRHLPDFHAAWWFLAEHPKFNHLKDGKPEPFMHGFMANLDVFVTRVNPETEQVDDEAAKNTATRVWLEAGPYAPTDSCGCDSGRRGSCYEEEPTHDIRLDCGGPTYEDAIGSMAFRVMALYGDYGQTANIPAASDKDESVDP